jgi:3-oxoacyl-[acyl-carrier-protein] synthase III
MKRLFPTSLALLLVMASLGHVLAAAFCPRALGHECCFAKTASHTHSSSSSQVNKVVPDMQMDGMSMDGMNMDDVVMADTSSLDHRAINDTTIDAATIDMSIPFSPPAFSEDVVANKFDQPIESCAHCFGHSGVANAPVSSVSVSDHSGKEIGSVLLPGSRFNVRPAIALAQIGLPREHAPPGSSTPRHILINVFLI